MDDTLVDTFYSQHLLGRKSGGTFTTQAIDCIVTEMRNAFPNTRVDEEQIHKHIKNFKK